MVTYIVNFFTGEEDKGHTLLCNLQNVVLNLELIDKRIKALSND